jgi:hypothetical protein
MRLSAPGHGKGVFRVDPNGRGVRDGRHRKRYRGSRWSFPSPR